MTLRVGLIGYGRIGAMHAGLVSRFVAGAQLAAIYEPVPEAARRAEVETGVRIVADEAALFSSGIDAVAICSSTPTHPRYIKMAAEAGIAAFCEKPISLDLDEAAEAAATATPPWRWPKPPSVPMTPVARFLWAEVGPYRADQANRSISCLRPVLDPGWAGE